MKKIRFPTLLGLGLIVMGVFGGVLLVQRTNSLNTQAFEDIKPNNINTSNITHNSFTVSWTTTIPTTGYIRWGTESNRLNNLAGIVETKKYVHYIEVTGLEPAKKYYFDIYTNSVLYRNEQSYEVGTGQLISPKPVVEIASGKIITQAGLEVEDAVVYANIPGGSTLSNKTTKSGQWIIPLSNMRLKDLSNYLKLDDEDFLDIFVDAGPLGNAQARIKATESDPVPPIVLGGFSDFTNETYEFSDNIPQSKLFDEQSEVRSSFDFLFD